MKSIQLKCFYRLRMCFDGKTSSGGPTRKSLTGWLQTRWCDYVS